MADASLNLYGDLDSIDLGGDNLELKLDNKKLLQRIKKLEFDIDKLCKELISMKRKQNVLTQNISELYKTAKSELERKDRIIVDLRREMDNTAFRRFKKSKIQAIGVNFPKAHDIQSKVNVDILKENIDQVYNRMNEEEKCITNDELGKTDYANEFKHYTNLERIKSKSPDQNLISHVNKSQNRKQSKSPKRNKSRTPERKKSRTPERKKSRTPNRKRSKSPIPKRGRSPNRKRSRSRDSRKGPNPKRSCSNAYAKQSEICKRKIFDLFENTNTIYNKKSRSPYRTHSKIYNKHENRRLLNYRRSRSKSPNLKQKSRSFSPKFSSKSQLHRSKSPSASKTKHFLSTHRSKITNLKSRTKSPIAKNSHSKSPVSLKRSRSRSPKIIKRSRRKSKSPVKIKLCSQYQKLNEFGNESRNSIKIERDKDGVTVNYNPRSRVRKMRISDGNSKNDHPVDSDLKSKVSADGSTKEHEEIIGAVITNEKIENTSEDNKVKICEEMEIKEDVNIKTVKVNDDVSTKSTMSNKSVLHSPTLNDLKEEKRSILCKINKDLYTDSHPILDMTNYKIPKKQKPNIKSKSGKHKSIEENKKHEEKFHMLIKEIHTKTPNKKELEKYKITSPTKLKTRELGSVSHQILQEINFTALRSELDTRKSIKTAELRHKSKSNKRKDEKFRLRRSSERSEESNVSTKSSSRSKSYDKMKDNLKEYNLPIEKVEICEGVFIEEVELDLPTQIDEGNNVVAPKTVEFDLKSTENIEVKHIIPENIDVEVELDQKLPIDEIVSCEKNVSSMKIIDNIIKHDKVTDKLHIISNVKIKSPKKEDIVLSNASTNNLLPDFIKEQKLVNGFTVTQNLLEVTYPSSLPTLKIETNAGDELNVNQNGSVLQTNENESTNLENTSTLISSTSLNAVPDTLNKSENSSNVVKRIPASRRRRCIVRIK